MGMHFVRISSYFFGCCTTNFPKNAIGGAIKPSLRYIEWAFHSPEQSKLTKDLAAPYAKLFHAYTFAPRHRPIASKNVIYTSVDYRKKRHQRRIR